LASRRQPSSPVIRERLKACRDRIQSKGLDGYLITSRVDQYYLTGFDGEDGAAIILPRTVCLVTDGRFAEEVARAAPWARTVLRKGSLTDAVARAIRRYDIKRLGFQPESLPYGLYQKLRRAVGATRMKPLSGVVSGLRVIKDASEVKRIEKAIRVAEGAFQSVLKRIRSGMTEHALAAELQYEMIRQGASEASFPIIVAEGPNSSVPHARPGQRRIRAGSAVLIDWGATVDHYRSDLTRVVFIRRIPPRFRRMYEHVAAAQAEAIAAIRPGARMCDVDGVARTRLKQANLDKRFSHGLGHGIGLEIHEAPRLSMRVKDRLEPGMVVTVEPGVYIPGVGGIRIEDDILVTDRDCRVLSRLPRDLDAMVV
jgi:Xaa-Pro aminopeptidase